MMSSNGLGVIFDVDGVLVDSYRAHLQSWQQAARSRGLEMSEEDFKKTFGRTSREIIHQLWPRRFDDAGVAAFDAQKESEYREILRKDFPEMPGASDLIQSLHDAGFALAIGSSGPPENVELVRKTIRHGEVINAIVNGKDVKHGKPDPEVFLVAAKKLGLDPRKCAVVEDAPVGVLAAKRSGAVPIALTGTAKREVLAENARIVVDRLRELTPKVIQDLIAEHQGR
jgi:beta-phosphoglucomutase